MDWLNAPIGMIRHDELLNALLALWKTQQRLASRNETDEFLKGYQAGFEEGLDVIAQVAGLTEAFEAGKASHRAKVKLNDKIEVIDGQVTFLDK